SVAAVFAALLGLAFSRLLARFGPMRLVPMAFGFGAVLHVLEYIILQRAGNIGGRILITIVYLHLVGFGAILLSGFWSVASEVVDPQRAKLRVGRIASAGSVGGICGGLLAERGAALFGPVSLLLLLALLHFAASIVLRHTTANNRRPEIYADDLEY